MIRADLQQSLRVFGLHLAHTLRCKCHGCEIAKTADYAASSRSVSRLQSASMWLGLSAVGVVATADYPALKFYQSMFAPVRS